MTRLALLIALILATPGCAWVTEMATRQPTYDPDTIWVRPGEWWETSDKELHERHRCVNPPALCEVTGRHYYCRC